MSNDKITISNLPDPLPEGWNLGCRLLGEYDPTEFPPEHAVPGAYWKTTNGEWWVRAPDERCKPARISRHHVEEHEDNTITVRPSILYRDGRGCEYHGWLERGIWRKA